MKANEYIEENKKRLDKLKLPYDPIRGIGSPLKRFKFTVALGDDYYLPVEMKENHLISEIIKENSLEEYVHKISKSNPTEKQIKTILAAIGEIRYDYDFEFWAFMTIIIEDKKKLTQIKFRLNRGQRKLLAYVEEQRLKGVPIRGVIAKARQWGGSTFVEIYSMWIQNRHKKNWHMVVCAQDDNAAKHIRHMYTNAADYYPKSAGKITLKPYEKSTKNLKCVENGGILGVGSVENPKQFRAYNYPMIHMSEVALWGETAFKSAKQLAQGLKSAIPTVPYSMIIEESTSKGVGNYFHDEWVAASSGKSGYFACFVAWHENENNEKEVKDYNTMVDEMINNTNFIPLMDENYHWMLWDLGCTLEQIAWYKWYMKFENKTPIEMFEEFPSTADESFVSSGRRAFPDDYVKNARETVEEPSFYGEIFGDKRTGNNALKNIKIEKMTNGSLSIWAMPDTTINVRDRYLVVMDIGGTTDKADWTVMKVFDRYWKMEGGKMEVVAIWEGHIDQDLGAWKAAQIAKIYGNALLVVERNSLRLSEQDKEEIDTDHSLTILDEIVEYYENIYARNATDKLREGAPLKYGWHTNKATKPTLVDALRKYLREKMYIERSKRSCDQMDYYEQKANGSYGAIKGKNDDHVVVTGIGCHIDNAYMDDPVLIVPKKHRTKSSVGMMDF